MHLPSPRLLALCVLTPLLAGCAASLEATHEDLLEDGVIMVEQAEVWNHTRFLNLERERRAWLDTQASDQRMAEVGARGFQGLRSEFLYSGFAGELRGAAGLQSLALSGGNKRLAGIAQDAQLLQAQLEREQLLQQLDAVRGQRDATDEATPATPTTAAPQAVDQGEEIAVPTTTPGGDFARRAALPPITVSQATRTGAEVLQDQLAYRHAVDSARRESAFDDLSHLHGTSTYLFKFDVVVRPGEATREDHLAEVVLTPQVPTPDAAAISARLASAVTARLRREIGDFVASSGVKQKITSQAIREDTSRFRAWFFTALRKPSDLTAAGFTVKIAPPGDSPEKGIETFTPIDLTHIEQAFDEQLRPLFVGPSHREGDDSAGDLNDLTDATEQQVLVALALWFRYRERYGDFVAFDPLAATITLTPDPSGNTPGKLEVTLPKTWGETCGAKAHAGSALGTLTQVLTAESKKVRVYAATPREYVQNLSDTAGTERALDLTGAFSASYGGPADLTAALRYVRQFQRQAQTIARNPLVIGFGRGDGSAGWLLGPRFVADAEEPDVDFRFTRTTYSLVAIVDVPAYCQTLDFTLRTNWLRTSEDRWYAIDGPRRLWTEDQIGTITSLVSTSDQSPLARDLAVVQPQRKLPVQLPHRDDALLYLRSSKLDGGLTDLRPRLYRVDATGALKPGRTLTLLIHGHELRHSPRVHIGAVRVPDTDVEVSPDLTSLWVRYTVPDLPGAALPVTVATAYGVDVLENALSVYKPASAPLGLESVKANYRPLADGSYELTLSYLARTSSTGKVTLELRGRGVTNIQGDSETPATKGTHPGVLFATFPKEGSAGDVLVPLWLIATQETKDEKGKPVTHKVVLEVEARPPARSTPLLTLDREGVKGEVPLETLDAETLRVLFQLPAKQSK